MGLFSPKLESRTGGSITADWWYENVPSLLSPATSGAIVNRNTALTLWSVYACVNAISNDLSTLPINVMRYADGSSSVAYDHPIYEKLKLRPTHNETASRLTRFRAASYLLDGNSYVFIERSRSDNVKGLHFIHPDSVSPCDKFGNIITDLKFTSNVTYYLVSDGMQSRIVKPSDIIHVKGWSDASNLKGESIITRYAKDSIGIGLEMAKFQALFFKQGLNPGGVIEMPGAIGEKAKPGFLEALELRYGGGNKNSRRPMVLENGGKFNQLDIKLVDQQYIEAVRMNQIEICGIFGVPPSRISISDSNTNFNNTEQETKRYFSSALLPIIVNDEQELSWKLLTQAERNNGFFIKYNFSAFLRGTEKDRIEIHEKWWRMGVPLNTLLEIEDRNPVPGGYDGRVQINTAPLISIDEIVEDEDIKNEK